MSAEREQYEPRMDAEMTEHVIIWLEPWCNDCARRDRSDTGRTWCCDPVYEPCECGAQPAKYILAAEAETEIERLTALLASCPCPGGGWNGMPKGLEATVAACVEHKVCGCTLGRALEGK